MDNIINKRLIFIFCIFVLFWLILLVRIFNLSIIDNQYYQEQATKNVLRDEVIAPIRGQIFDRNGEPLATNNIGFSLTFPPRLSLPANLPILEQETQKLIEFFPQYTKEELIAKYKQRIPLITTI